MYLHIFGPMRWLRICGYTGAIFTTVFYGAMMVTVFGLMTPGRGETWFLHQSTPDLHDASALSVPQSVVGLAIDLAILILPIIAVMELQLPIRRKIGVILIFMTGSLACLCSMLSIYYRNILYRSADVTWNLSPVNTVTVLEIHHLQYFENFKSYVHSHALNLALISRWSQGPSTSESVSTHSAKKCKPPSRQYGNIGVHQGEAQSKSIRTFIQGGTQSDVESDGIHLTYEMQKEFSSADRWASQITRV